MPSTSPPIVLAGSGIAVVNGSGPGGHLSSLFLPGSTFSATALVMPVTDIIGAFPLAGLRLTAHNAAGTAFGPASRSRVSRECVPSQRAAARLRTSKFR